MSTGKIYRNWDDNLHPHLFRSSISTVPWYLMITYYFIIATFVSRDNSEGSLIPGLAGKPKEKTNTLQLFPLVNKNTSSHQQQRLLSNMGARNMIFPCPWRLFWRTSRVLCHWSSIFSKISAMVKTIGPISCSFLCPPQKKMIME